MNKIIDLSSRFAPKQEIVFTCMQCQGQIFWINDGGTVSCRTCNLRQKVATEWLKTAVELLEETEGFKVEWEESDEDE